jgi:hypothetical protein
MFDKSTIHYLDLVLASGHCSQVPQFIVRIDTDDWHGWQLRYGEWTGFEDAGAGHAGVCKALAQALEEMHSRMDYVGK